MKCHYSKPYPLIRVQKRNSDIAKLLLHSYAGDISEDTAIHQYLFQSVLLEDKNEEVAQILKEISQVEMHHLHILATLIKKLGVYPIYFDPIVSTTDFWTSRNVSYETNLYEMICSDIEAEKMAITQYQGIISTIDDDYVKEILKRIMAEERLHLEIFEKILETL